MERLQTVSRKKVDASHSLQPVDFAKARIEHAQAQKTDARLLEEVAQHKREASAAEQVSPICCMGSCRC